MNEWYTLLSACLLFLDLPLDLGSPQSQGWFGHSLLSRAPSLSKKHAHTKRLSPRTCAVQHLRSRCHPEWFLWKYVTKKKILQPTLYRYGWLRVQVFGDRPCLRLNRKWTRTASMQMRFRYQRERKRVATEERPGLPAQLTDDSSDAVTQESLDRFQVSCFKVNLATVENLCLQKWLGAALRP